MWHMIGLRNRLSCAVPNLHRTEKFSAEMLLICRSSLSLTPWLRVTEEERRYIKRCKSRIV